MVKKLTRFEIADIKVVMARTSSLRRKRDAIVGKIASLEKELEVINSTIDKWEEPIMDITCGLSPEEALGHIVDGVLTFSEDETRTEAEPTVEGNSDIEADNADMPEALEVAVDSVSDPIGETSQENAE